MEGIVIVLQVLLTGFTLYYIGISFFSFFRRRENYTTPPAATFAVVVAAHNEEKVIGELVKSIFRMDYPRNLYEVFVIADNCTDHTAAIAAKEGATVIKRFNDREKGKGYALEYGFQQIFRLKRNFDAIVVLDADNLISPNFLNIMNHRLARGEKIIQGYLATKNPNDTWITRSIYVGYLITNRFWQLAKYNLGLTCALGGTGMCIASDVLQKFGWGMTSLTEDLEFQTKALFCGLKVSWAHDAVVYDEKPLTMKQSWRQRQRWMQGHCNVASRYFFKLVWQGLVQKDFRKIDGAIYLMQPYFTMLMGVGLLYSIVNWQQVNWWWFLSGFIFQYFYLGLALFLERAHPRAYLWLLYYPFFTMTWIPITFAGFIHRNNKVWSHTKHVRSISYEQLRGQTQ
ncbi:glycosyltransferase [Desulfofundulus thermobenzoicus]|uniref:Glycosyltransferase n=2 Tax=Desulfofundulus thermobenzoicus TaxID=29376 RepID=A0A6N7INF6_9FIRM|nr:glycosyltransferase [Desulfofundulus thermobenzoicus]HHW42360.1 glycosyltransferase family 2 protein [Desulfotomaculum sp.]